MYSPEFNAGIGYVRFNLAEDHIGNNYYIGNLDSSKHTCNIGYTLLWFVFSIALIIFKADLANPLSGNSFKVLS